MKKAVALAIAVAFLMSMVGCYTHIYDVGNGGSGGKEAYKHWHNHFLWGIIGDKKLTVNDICPSGNATIKDEITFVNGLIGFLCLGGLVYYPSTVKIECADGKTGELEITEEQIAAIASDPSFLDDVAENYPELYPAAVLAAEKAAE